MLRGKPITYNSTQHALLIVAEKQPLFLVASSQSASPHDTGEEKSNPSIPQLT